MAQTHVSCRFFTTEPPGKPPALLELLRVTLLQESLPLDYLAEDPKEKQLRLPSKSVMMLEKADASKKGSVAQVILVLEALLSAKR